MGVSNQIVSLYWNSLKNEIDAETWKAGKCYITEDKAEERAEAQTGNDTLDKNYCYRKIEQGIMQLQDIAHKFFVGFHRDATITKSWKKVTDWTTLEIGDKVKVTDKGATSAGESTAKTISSVPTTTSNINALIFTDSTSAVSNVKDLWIEVAEQSESESTSNSSDDKLNNGVTKWVISLRFGDRQNVNVSLLAGELHKYVVLNVLQEWCKIANPTLTQEYIKRQAEEEIRIKSIMYRKEEPGWND